MRFRPITRVLLKDVVTFSKVLDFQNYKMSSIISEGLLRDSQFLAHFAEDYFTLYIVKKTAIEIIQEGHNSCKGYILPKCWSNKNPKCDGIKQREVGLSYIQRLYDENKKTPTEIHEKHHAINFKLGMIRFFVSGSLTSTASVQTLFSSLSKIHS